MRALASARSRRASAAMFASPARSMCGIRRSNASTNSCSARSSSDSAITGCSIRAREGPVRIDGGQPGRPSLHRHAIALTGFDRRDVTAGAGHIRRNELEPPFPGAVGSFTRHRARVKRAALVRHGLRKLHQDVCHNTPVLRPVQGSRTRWAPNVRRAWTFAMFGCEQTRLPPTPISWPVIHQAADAQ